MLLGVARDGFLEVGDGFDVPRRIFPRSDDLSHDAEFGVK